MMNINLVKKDKSSLFVLQTVDSWFHRIFHMDLYFSGLLVAMNLFDSTVKYGL